eukprot:57867_1
MLIIMCLHLEKHYIIQNYQLILPIHHLSYQSELRQDPDFPWFHICPHTILYMIGDKFESIDKCLSNDAFLNRCFGAFEKHYNIWKQKLHNSAYSGIFCHPIDSVKDQYKNFKKYILTKIKQNWVSLRKLKNNTDKQLTSIQIKSQLNKNKNNFLDHLYDTVIDIMPIKFPAIRMLYDIALNELRTETIVESINSVIKTIYTQNRRSMTLETLIKHVMIRLLLPKKHKYRNEIVKLCGQMFELMHGDQIVTTWYAKKK